MVASNPFSGWEAYARLQQTLDRRQVGVAGWAADEALTAVAAEVAEGISGVEVLLRFRGHWLNRLRKYRERAKLDAAYLNEHLLARPRYSDDPATIAIKRDLIAAVRRGASDFECHLLRSLANGESYSALADSIGVSIGQLRTQVCRLRARLRGGDPESGCK